MPTASNAPSGSRPDNRYERRLMDRYGGLVAGVDEVGRGPLAGPVVAAAVILDPERVPVGLADSKALKADTRERLARCLADVASIGIGIVDAATIDRINILAATMLAMTQALANLPCRPSACLIDGNRLPESLPYPGEAVIKGDAKVLSIAAASIVAKVTRDAIMLELDARYPGYGWAANKGYGTKAHLEGLERLGPCPLHRRTFAPVRRALAAGTAV